MRGRPIKRTLRDPTASENLENHFQVASQNAAKSSPLVSPGLWTAVYTHQPVAGEHQPFHLRASTGVRSAGADASRHLSPQ